MAKDLEGKLALVAGGGSGIGEAVCKLFAAQGANVIVADIKNAEAVLSSLQGSNHLAVTTDVSKSESVDSLWESILNHYEKPPSILVHSAGIMGNLQGLEACTEEIFDKVINVNLKGTYLVNRKFALLMRDHGIKGSIVNVSSISIYGASFSPEYAATKAGLWGFTQSIAKELAKYGIRCNTVHPGAIATPFVSQFPVELTEAPSVRPKNIPLGRNGTADEVAQVCLFLASDKSSYVTLSSYCVHGGLTENPVG